MFNQAFENFRRATEATLQMQQDMFKAWINLWPVSPTSPTFLGEQAQHFQKKWAEVFGEMLKKQREVTGECFKAGLENLEQAFKVAESKSPEELRSQSIDLWKKCFADIQHVYEAQLRGFQFATEKWAELATKKCEP